MANLYACFNEMQELYNSFDQQYDVLQDHHTRRMASTKDFDNILGWKKHIRDRSHDFPVMDKFQTKKIEVTIKTWEKIFDAIESIIKGGQATFKHRWTAGETLLSYLDFLL